MNKSLMQALACFALIALATPAFATSDSFWKITSPDHAQTFAFGTETNRVWRSWNGHLALLLDYTNDPFVDRTNPRQYDDFRFDFPMIRIGADGRTFYYHASDGRSIPIASKRPGLFGVEEVRLLPNANLVISKPSGYITVYLDVFEPNGVARR